MTQDHLSVSPESRDPIDRVVSWILADISSKHNLDLSQDPVAMERIREAVEKASLELVDKPQVEINLPFISATSSGPIHYQRLLTNTDFDQSIPDAYDPDPASDHPSGRTQIKLPDQRPVVTTSLMIITGLIYIIQLITIFSRGYDLTATLGYKKNDLIMAGQYWRLITPVLLHGSILHLGFNMYALYILGRRLERFFGSFRFLGLYIIAGITGNIFSFLLTESPSLGSSTAIFGLLSAEAIFIYQHRDLFGEQFQVAIRQILQVAGINLLIGLSPGIDNWGHVGGLIGGAFFSWFGGPILEVQDTPPHLRLGDTKSGYKVITVFVISLLILIGFLALIIRSRL
jgi:rhomboid protease GluP